MMLELMKYEECIFAILTHTRWHFRFFFLFNLFSLVTFVAVVLSMLAVFPHFCFYFSFCLNLIQKLDCPQIRICVTIVQIGLKWALVPLTKSFVWCFASVFIVTKLFIPYFLEARWTWQRQDMIAIPAIHKYASSFSGHGMIAFTWSYMCSCDLVG